jgi:predicted DNA binding CopG/RHH family protein
MRKKTNLKLNAEERKFLRSVERGEWKPIESLRTNLRKSRRVSIRLSPDDLRGIQSRAIEEGIPYQILIASVFHKYVTGRLVEKRAPKRAGSSRRKRSS